MTFNKVETPKYNMMARKDIIINTFSRLALIDDCQ